MTKLCQFNVNALKWHLAYFVPIKNLMAILAKLLDMDFKFVLPLIYINFNIQTNFEVNQTQIGNSIPKNTPIKITKMAISQNYILPKCHLPKSLLLQHFSINLSETFRINLNMDFSHISRD